MPTTLDKSPQGIKERKPKNLGITIGQINRLQIARLSPHGAYLAPIAHAPKSKGLESSERGKVDSSKLPKTAPSPRQITHALYEVLLPKKFCPSQAQIGDTILAFVYTDSLDRPVATTQMPLAQCGEVAFLRVVGQTGNGVFLDLGLDKDIFMPSKTPAKYPLDSRVAVYITLDKSSRLIAKKDIQSHLLPYRARGYARGKKVSILPFSVSDLGVSVVVDSRYYGLVYLPQSVRDKQKSPESTLAAMGLGLGLESSAFIHNVRSDGKLDLVLHKRDRADESAAKLLQVLRDNGGKLAVHYDSSPESTFALLGMSKKALKRALSDLLARKLIILSPQVGIELV
ncbi:S1-like domain-containing RNA-binding protein [Helicobacter canis]|uniref:S1-like domain-containing RNA-binding protein n=1 Tax=Helicobacter canis TaxID=29419 RepID=UPI002943DB75|nr:S1-like domain-containing RNA-binding protein [Helicobacter canis]